MTEDMFWNLIEDSCCGQNLKECLNPLTEEELFGFRYWWEYFHGISYRQDLWAVAYVVLEGCGDDEFDYFRFWLISRGRKVFHDAMENVDSLHDVFCCLGAPTGPDCMEQEDLDYAVQEVLAERTGDGEYFYDEIEKYEMPPAPSEIEFEWNEDDLDSIRRICPRIFEKWWAGGLQ